MSKYDVFLSHNSTDKAAVEQLAHRLADEAALQPFLDKWHLIPGEPWQEALEEALNQSRTCAVFLGQGRLGPWENEEMRAALDERARNPGFRVIPVLLPNAQMPERGRLPRFLSRLTWVDFRQGLEDGEAFYRLTCGIQGIVPGAPAEAGQPAEAVRPYRGLRVFEEEHAEFFFGRAALTQWLVEGLRDSHFLAVLGPSGSGKSSVVRAGLMPELRRGALPASDTWTILIMTPGARPLEALAAFLVPLVGGEGDQVGRMLQLQDSLRDDRRGLHAAVQLILVDQDPSTRLLLVIDQFEELFTLCRSEDERQQFLDNLLYASSLAQGRTVTVLTMRADFYPRAAAYAELADRLADQQVLISPLVEDELREAIEAPAQRVGLAFDPGLVDTIVEDVAGQPGALPLLQHALLELWERRQGRQLTFEAYREIGGVNGAIARRAEAEYAHLPPDQQAVARRILLRLVQPGEGTVDTRRRARLSELVPDPEAAAAVEDVVHTLADARLLTTGRDTASGEELVDVAHEALVQGWPRLRRWLDEDRAALRTHRRLTERAQEWAQLDHDEGSLLRGVQLAEVAEWAGQHSSEMNALEREFLEASQAEQERQAQVQAEQRQKEEQLAAEQRTAGRLRRMAIGLAIVFVFALAAAVFAVIQRANALNAQATAVAGQSTAVAESAKALNAQATAQTAATAEAAAKETAIIAEATATVALAAAQAAATAEAAAQAQQLAAEERARLFIRSALLAAESQLASESEPELRVPLAIEALALTEAAGLPALPSTQQALVDALVSRRDIPSFIPKGGAQSGTIAVAPLSFSPNPNPAWLYGVSRRSGIRRWEICPNDSTALCSPDDTDVDPRFGEGVPALNLDEIDGPAYFSADGRWIAATSADDSRVRLLPLDPEDSVVEPIEFDIGAQDDTIIGFSPDGRWLATMAPRGTTVRLWDLAVAVPEANPVNPPGHNSEIRAAAFSYDGRWLATAGSDRSLQLWDLIQKKNEPDLTLNSNADVWAMAFSPDNRWLAAGPALFDLTGLDSSGPPGTPIVLPGHPNRVQTVAFSPDSSWLVTSGLADGTSEKVSTLLWNLTADDPVSVPINLPHRNYVVDRPSFNVKAATFSPDGRWLATSIDQVSILLWPLQIGDLITVGCQAAEREFTPDEWERYFPQEEFRQTCVQ